MLFGCLSLFIYSQINHLNKTHELFSPMFAFPRYPVKISDSNCPISFIEERPDNSPMSLSPVLILLFRIFKHIPKVRLQIARIIIEFLFVGQIAVEIRVGDQRDLIKLGRVS